MVLMLKNKYFWLRFGLANVINNHLRLNKICVCREFLTLILINCIRQTKSESKKYILPTSWHCKMKTGHITFKSIQEVFLSQRLFVFEYYLLFSLKKILWNNDKKRFYTRGTLKGILISRLDKIPTLYRDWLRSLNLQKGWSFELHRREGGLKDIHRIA